MKPLLCTFVLALSAFAQSTRITWIGQACFYVQTENGPTVVTDPPAANIGYVLPSTPADAVTISHNHPDHNNSAGVRGSFALIDGRPTTARTAITAANTPFVLIPGFHDTTNGSLRGPNTIVTWTQGGLRFAHFGDYGQSTLTGAQLNDLGDIDVMMLPAGGAFTIENAQTPELVAQVKPKIAILMHFRTGLGGPAQLPTAPAVANPFPNVRYQPSSVVVSRATLPRGNEVWLMEPAGDSVVVNAATSTAGLPVAPGSLSTVWGSFGTAATIKNTASGAPPLPRKLADIEVLIGTEAVPLLFVSPRQINFQVPRAFTAGQYPLEVRLGGQRVARGPITITGQAPGLFVAVDAQGRINRAARGGVITIFGTGQGVTSNPPADGTAAVAAPLAQTTATPEVLVGGRRATVTFSGLAPNWVGLWQVNAEVPRDAPTGNGALSIQFAPNLPSNALPLTID